MGTLGILGIIIIIYNIIKAACEPTIPASYWRNADLIHEDAIKKGIVGKEFEKNLRSGKYK